jgi:3-polyprenyl-4-hydroxybenzoate decarboxylase
MYATSSKALGIGFAAETWRRLRVYHELPIIGCWPAPMPSGYASFWISIEKTNPEVVNRAALGQHGFLPIVTKSLIVDETVDPSNNEDAMEAFSLNVHPGRDIRKVNTQACIAIKYEPFLSIEEKKEGLKKGVYFDCTGKTDNKWINFEQAFPREVQEWVEQNWGKLGFEKPATVFKEKRGEYVIRPMFKSIVD